MSEIITPIFLILESQKLNTQLLGLGLGMFMTSQTSMVAEQVRLKQWAGMVSDCQNRSSGMKVEDWYRQNGISKADYYYRLRRVRKFCINAYENSSPIEIIMTI